MRKQTKALVLVAAVAAAMSLTACNTVQGAGEDVKAAGAAVSNTAADAKQEIAK